MPSELAEVVMLTTHPSAILRARDQDTRTAAMDEFVRDLTRAARWLEDWHAGSELPTPAGTNADH
jgi:hypothetical protein